MIKEVKIYNRFNMENFARFGGMHFPYVERPWYLVSIHTDEDDPFLTEKNTKLINDFGCLGSISLRFWDITDDQAISISEGTSERSKKLCKEMKLFNKEQAKEVVGFLSAINQGDEEDGVLVAHCDAGISRSGAIGTFAVDFLRLDYQEFINSNPYIRPNYYVLRILRQLSDMTPKFTEECQRRDSASEKGQIYHKRSV